MKHCVPLAASTSQWTTRELELLAATLRLLQEHGYNRLSVDAVATEAKASKATVYRRWPSKDELVLAAVSEATYAAVEPPHSGSLRSDLLRVGSSLWQQASLQAGTLRAVMAELARNPALSVAVREDFLRRHRSLITGILNEAADRGEIDSSVVNDELWDVLPGYLLYRSLIPGRPPTRKTVRLLVDEVLMPSLTRTRPGSI
ncbi:TetR/AcrR family transcriptional regulator [Mycobacterium colombiense]